MGADVNYKHPASHGNAPLLRCAEMGYDECLGVLLSDPAARVAELSTNEYKLVLGQNVPQYEAGGRSALLLATEAGQQESVFSTTVTQVRVDESGNKIPLEAS